MAERTQLATEQDVTNYANETNTKLTTLQTDVTAVKDNTEEINTNTKQLEARIGSNADTADDTSLFGQVKDIIEGIFNISGSTTANSSGSLSQKLSYIISSLIGATNSTGGGASSGTLMAKVNALLSSWTSTRAGYIDTINTNANNAQKYADNARTYARNAQDNTITNNTGNKTGVLSQKLTYLINLLENTTYGLNAIKNQTNNLRSYSKVEKKQISLYKTDTQSYQGNAGRYIYLNYTNDSIRFDSLQIIIDGNQIVNAGTSDSIESFLTAWSSVPYLEAKSSFKIILKTSYNYSSGSGSLKFNFSIWS